MNTRAELKNFSEFVTTIKSITRVYEQAAARKMKSVRVEIEKINEYLEEAKNTYSNSKIALVAREKPDMREAILRTSFRKIEKEKILVLISSQSSYFGNLIPSLFKLFLEEYRRSGSDAVILGRIGKELLDKGNISYQNITYYDFDDMIPDWKVLHDVGQIVAQYAKIVVFYGQYKGVLTQEIKQADINQSVVVHNVEEVRKYLFRPEGGQALTFLENQMILGDLLAKIYHAQVAKYAARIKILEIGQVAEKISQAMDQLGKSRRKVRKSVYNKKQQQLFVGSSLWVS